MMKSYLRKFLAIFGINLSRSDVLTGKCDYVQDGDSLKLKLDGSGKIVRIRLYGIDAPEKGQDYAAHARRRLLKLTRHKRLRVVVMDLDEYGRYVGKVYVGDRYINPILLREGLARVYSHYTNPTTDSDLLAAQRTAQSIRAGLWSTPDSPTPRQWRTTHGTTHSPKDGE